MSDGIIITGTSTGKPVDTGDLESVKNLNCLKLIGSGLTESNLPKYYPLVDGFIVGSSLKKDGIWSNAPDPVQVARFVEVFERLG